jgi:hypothetical protein
MHFIGGGWSVIAGRAVILTVLGRMFGAARAVIAITAPLAVRSLHLGYRTASTVAPGRVSDSIGLITAALAVIVVVVPPAMAPLAGLALAFQPVIRPAACKPIGRLRISRQLVTPLGPEVALEVHNAVIAAVSFPAESKKARFLFTAPALCIQLDTPGFKVRLVGGARTPTPVRLGVGARLVAGAAADVHGRSLGLGEMKEHVLPAVRAAVEPQPAVPDFTMN